MPATNYWLCYHVRLGDDGEGIPEEIREQSIMIGGNAHDLIRELI